jgi:RNA polymerase sigma factor (sigma-70 family)
LPGTEPDPPRGRFDPNAFYLEHLAELLSFFQRTARRLGIDAGEDTLQDVWIKLRDNHEKIDTSDPRIVVAWCKKAGANHLLDLIRSGYHSYEEPHSNLAIIDAERALGAVNNPEQQWADRADLRRSLINMPGKLAEVFLLAADGYSNTEIAEMLGITPTAAQKRLTRARTYARHRLGAFVAGVVPIWAFTQTGRAARRTLGRPSQILVTSIGSLSVVLAFGVPIVPANIALPAPTAHGFTAATPLAVTGRPAPARKDAMSRPGAQRRPAAGAAHRPTSAKPGIGVPYVPSVCGPHLCVGSCKWQQGGDRVYVKTLTTDPCKGGSTEGVAPICEAVPDNPAVGCQREGDPQWVVDPPPGIQPSPSPSPGGQPQ